MEITYLDQQAHDELMNVMYHKTRMDTLEALKPKLIRDGNAFIFLYGENIQEGIAGCGMTPLEAAYDFHKHFCEDKIFTGKTLCSNCGNEPDDGEVFYTYDTMPKQFFCYNCTPHKT